MSDPTVAALAPVVVDAGALVRPAAGVDVIAEAFDAYQALCARLLTPDDFQAIKGREYRKKSAWRKLAVAFGVSCSYLERNYERDDAGRLIRAEVIVRATAPNGRYMDGLGICDRSERVFTKPEHDIPATAATRATNRACSDLFGMGEVSAEEITEEAVTKPLKVVTQGAPRGTVEVYYDEDTGERMIGPPAEDEQERRALNAARAGLFRALDPKERAAYDDFRTSNGIGLTKAGRDYTLDEARKCHEYLTARVERPF